MKKWVKFSELGVCFRAKTTSNHLGLERWVVFNEYDLIKAKIDIDNDIINVCNKECIYSSMEKSVDEN